MSEPPTWPPPPDTPHPLAVHDEFLSACVRSSTPKPPLSRLRLVRDLRNETGLDLRSCLAVVNSFCDRHAIFLPMRGPLMWIGFLPPLIMLLMAAAEAVSFIIFERRHDEAVTHLERITITAEKWHLTFAFLGVYLVAACITVVLTHWRIKKTREQATEARAKFMR